MDIFLSKLRTFVKLSHGNLNVSMKLECHGNLNVGNLNVMETEFFVE